MNGKTKDDLSLQWNTIQPLKELCIDTCYNMDDLLKTSY